MSHLSGMDDDEKATSQRSQRGILAALAIVLLGAAGSDLFGTAESLPVLGSRDLLPVTLAAALLCLWLDRYLIRNGIAAVAPSLTTLGGATRILVLGAALALPPIAIDLTLGFPRELNLASPEALGFYPAIAVVAEAVFHLLPLALLTAIIARRVSPLWLLGIVALIEPLFQMVFVSGAPLQRVLVFCNVALISAAQLWLYRRQGFVAMLGLRWAYYLFWHIGWGQLRLWLLF